MAGKTYPTLRVPAPPPLPILSVPWLDTYSPTPKFKMEKVSLGSPTFTQPPLLRVSVALSMLSVPVIEVSVMSQSESVPSTVTVASLETDPDFAVIVPPLVTETRLPPLISTDFAAIVPPLVTDTWLSPVISKVSVVIVASLLTDTWLAPETPNPETLSLITSSIPMEPSCELISPPSVTKTLPPSLSLNAPLHFQDE